MSTPDRPLTPDDVDARILRGGFCLAEALYVHRTSGLDWSEYQRAAAKRAIAAAVDIFGFETEAAVLAYHYPHEIHNMIRPSGRG